jgi:PAS domain S-box-containing protein
MRTPKDKSGKAPKHGPDEAPAGERPRAEGTIEELRRRRGVFVDAVQATRMAMIITDPTLPGDPIVFANPSFLELSGYGMEEVLGRQPHFMNGPDTDPDAAARFRLALEEDRDEFVETVQYRKNGSRFIATVFVSAFKDDTGRTTHHFLSFLDVTRQVAAEKKVQVQSRLRKSEERLRLLLGELQHRVRNTLAVVRSIARRTAERADTVDEFMSHFDGRLNAFARVQAAVARTAEGSVNLKGIIEDELLALATREGEHLRIDGPEVELKPRAAETISLAIHELATNAVKYGALAAEHGRVAISWRRIQGDDGDTLEFEWVESGLDPRPKSTHEGFGHEMLLRTLPYDLEAKTDIAFNDDGIRFTMHMPLGPDVLAE